MATITLTYFFGPEEDSEFEYEAEIDFNDYLVGYLEDTYASAKDAAEELSKDVDEDDVERLLKCETFDDLASEMEEIDSDWAQELIEGDDRYWDGLKDELKEGSEEDARDAFDDETSCDPDGFYGWDDYYRWKNG